MPPVSPPAPDKDDGVNVLGSDAFPRNPMNDFAEDMVTARCMALSSNPLL